MDWFLYDNGLRHERVNEKIHFFCRKREKQAPSYLANSQTFIAFKTDPDGQFPDNLRSRNSN